MTPPQVPWMKLHKIKEANRRMSKDEGWNRSRSAGACAACREIIFKTDRIHLFDVRCWAFNVRRSSVFFD